MALILPLLVRPIVEVTWGNFLSSVIKVSIPLAAFILFLFLWYESTVYFIKKKIKE